MEIKRINSYIDSRFSLNCLLQHGCFEIDGEPYEIEICSEAEAVVRGENRSYFPELIEEFRFYTPHIYIFYDREHQIIKQYEKPLLFEVDLDDIQPSQFYVDNDKVGAVATFIKDSKDIIVQVVKYNDRYISLDGHTRLFYAYKAGFKKVKAISAETDASIYDFVNEAIKREIHTPKDLILLKHEEYEEKWNRYCEEY